MTTYHVLFGDYDKEARYFRPHRDMGEFNTFESLRAVYDQMRPEDSHIMIFIKTNTDRDNQTFISSGYYDVLCADGTATVK